MWERSIELLYERSEIDQDGSTEILLGSALTERLEKAADDDAAILTGIGSETSEPNIKPDAAVLPQAVNRDLGGIDLDIRKLNMDVWGEPVEFKIRVDAETMIRLRDNINGIKKIHFIHIEPVSEDEIITWRGGENFF